METPVSFWCFFGFCCIYLREYSVNRVAMRKRVIRIAAVLLLIMGSAFAKVRKLETVQTDGSVSAVRPRVALTFDDGPSPK